MENEFGSLINNDQKNNIDAYDTNADSYSNFMTKDFELPNLENYLDLTNKMFIDLINKLYDNYYIKMNYTTEMKYNEYKSILDRLVSKEITDIINHFSEIGNFPSASRLTEWKNNAIMIIRQEMNKLLNTKETTQQLTYYDDGMYKHQDIKQIEGFDNIAGVKSKHILIILLLIFIFIVIKYFKKSK